MASEDRYEIFFLKYPHEDSMTMEQEKTRVRRFNSMKEAEEWAKDYCQELPSKSKEIWRVYNIIQYE